MLPPLERLRHGALAARSGGQAGHGLFFVAHNVSNILNYAFLLVMSRALPAGDFALFAALFGAVYLASALANTAQTSIAAVMAGSGEETGGAVVGDATRRLIAAALPFGAAVLIVARPVTSFLHSQDLTPVVLTGAAIWLSLLASLGYGALQGSGRFALLGGGLIAASAGRFVLGAAFVWWGLGVSGALLGIVLGLGLSAVLVLLPFLPSILRRLPGALPPRPPVLAALLTSVAVAIPTSADVLLARHYFPVDEAAAYAAVSVLGKVIIFGPLAVSLIFFPAFVRRSAAGAPVMPLLRLSLIATAVVSLPLAGAVLALGVLARGIVLPGHNVSSSFLVAYLAAMLAFSLFVTLLYFNLARRKERLVAAAPVALAVSVVAIALWHASPLFVALELLTCNLLLLTAGLWVSVRPLRTAHDSGRRVWAVASALLD